VTDRLPRVYMGHPDLHLALFTDIFGPAFVPPWRDPEPDYRAVIPHAPGTDPIDDPHEDAARPAAQRREQVPDG
jgi:hypothetical protein